MMYYFLLQYDLQIERFYYINQIVTVGQLWKSIFEMLMFYLEHQTLDWLIDWF